MQNLSIHFFYNILLVWMGAKIDGQHDVDDLCRNNYLINVKIYSHIYLHTTSNIEFCNCFFSEYNVHICSNGALYHIAKVGI